MAGWIGDLKAGQTTHQNQSEENAINKTIDKIQPTFHTVQQSSC